MRKLNPLLVFCVLWPLSGSLAQAGAVRFAAHQVKKAPNKTAYVTSYAGAVVGVSAAKEAKAAVKLGKLSAKAAWKAIY